MAGMKKSNVKKKPMPGMAGGGKASVKKKPMPGMAGGGKSSVKKKPMPGMRSGMKVKGQGMDKRRGGMQMPMVENFNDMIKRRFGGKV
jgi:hypothetical protein